MTKYVYSKTCFSLLYAILNARMDTYTYKIHQNLSTTTKKVKSITNFSFIAY